MSPGVVGLLHPGEMGASVGAALAAQGTRVLWASQGRSPETAGRAAGAGLVDAGDLDALVAGSGIIVSVCPPHAALEVAGQVAARRFGGIYVDANAVAPATVAAIAATLGRDGARVVDGALIGGPMQAGSGTRLYLSGADAPAVAELLDGSDRGEAVVLGPEPTAASALKMAYAAWTKGTAALLLAIDAAGRATGVERHLAAEWQRTQPSLVSKLEGARRSAPKAWRWSGEMEEIASTFRDVGLPDGFALAAADVWRRVTEGELDGGAGGLAAGGPAAGGPAAGGLRPAAPGSEPHAGRPETRRG